jgi:tetratricopeptide (TPR) repeat protein
MLKRMLFSLMLFISWHGFGQVDPYLAGRASMEKSSFDSALYYLQRALEQHPGDTEILYYLGLTQFTLQHYPASREAFYEAEKRRKGMGSFYLAKNEVKLNHPEQALKYLRIHLDSRYRKPESEILLDEDLSTLQGKPGWQQLWEEKKWYSLVDEEYQEAMFLKNNGELLEAINLLNTLEKKGYKKSEVQTLKASIFAELGNDKAARSELRSAVKSDVRNLDAVQVLARYQVKEGEIEEAIDALNRVIRQDPARFDAYLQRAEAKSLKGDLPGALDDMQLYLTYFPSDDEAIYRKGKMQFDNGKYLDALQSFNRALEMNRGNPAYFYARGLTYASTGTIRFAEKDYSMALDLDPENGEIWFEKGKISDRLGKRSDACHCYQMAFQLGIFDAGAYLDKNCNQRDGN